MGVAHDIRRYALLGAASLIAELSEEELTALRAVLLFGSAAKGTATEESDIDLFFDVELPVSGQKKLRARLNRLAAQFALSQTALQYKMRGIENEFSIAVGRLDEWPDLKRSIISTGIAVYGQYLAQPAGLRPYVVFTWEKIPLKAKGAFLNKIYGYVVKGKRYPGMVDKLGGRRIGRAAAMMQKEHGRQFEQALRKYRVPHSILEVWSDA